MNQFWKLYSSPFLTLVWLGFTFFSFQEIQDIKQEYKLPYSQINQGESSTWQLIEDQAHIIPVQSFGLSLEKFQDCNPIFPGLSTILLGTNQLALQVIKTQGNINPDYSIRKLIFPFHFFW